MDLLSLEPKAIWKNFAALNAVPRPSKKEEKVIAFIKNFGESLGLETKVDATGNVVIYKPASKGMENRQMVTLQSHLDMVCQKNNDKVFDFETQGIQMLVEGDWVTADGTTLGADNGIGVATIMSILESENLVHPPIEALFTIDEETGMTGAFGLQPGFLKGDILLNLDTEEDDEIDIGCAGGVDVTATRTFESLAVEGEAVSLEIKGLQGGHSGMDIHKGLGNANVLLTRILFAGLESGFQLVKIDGGGLRNAIPREAKALVYPKDIEKFLQAAATVKADLLDEYKTLEPDLEIKISKENVNAKALSLEASIGFVRALKAAHNGVYRMSPDVEDLVEASNNIARVALKDGNATVMCLTRSSVDSTKFAVADQLKACFELADMEVAYTGAYPGWKPNPHSEIVEAMVKIYKEKFNEEPKVVACHAGLECGIIGASHPNMDMVSFGPTIRGAHSPDEKVNVKSVQKFWGFLQDILKAIPEK